MSVDTKTLRIGSHILVSNERVEIEQIVNESLIGYITPSNDWFGVDPIEDWVEPIPIDENELRRCGFVGDGPDVFIDHKSACIMREDCSRIPDVRICKCQDGYWGVAMLCSSFHCRYLHELEAMYYHVFKKELIEG